MARGYALSRRWVIDIRPAAAYAQGHVPFALDVPAEVFAAHRDNPETLADALAAAAVEPLFEAVVASEGGINPQSARAFVILERLGQKRCSILADSLDD